MPVAPPSTDRVDFLFLNLSWPPTAFTDRIRQKLTGASSGPPADDVWQPPLSLSWDGDPPHKEAQLLWWKDHMEGETQRQRETVGPGQAAAVPGIPSWRGGHVGE